MAWLVQTKPHFKTVYACGLVVAECACTRGGCSKPTFMLTRMCPDCERKAKGRPSFRTYLLKHAHE